MAGFAGKVGHFAVPGKLRDNTRLDASGNPVREATRGSDDEDMAKRENVSAGLLLFRRKGSQVEYFLAHPGGPFWRGRDDGAWTIPKGMLEAGEEPLEAAIREFQEETGVEPTGPYLSLGAIRQRAGKIVHAWAWEGDADPAAVHSNEARREFPRGSGRWITYPEVDRCGWFALHEAKRLVNPAQSELIERLHRKLLDDER